MTLLPLALLACTTPDERVDRAADTAPCVPAVEVPYDAVDQDCDGADLVDVDGDGHAATDAGGPDCDDTDPAIHPDAAEACDGVDNDCDGVVDLTETWHPDRDDDGFGDADVSRDTCDPPDGYVRDGTDCDDDDASVFPGAPEACNGWDDDCDGVVPADEDDRDGDGFRGCDDCDDTDPAVHPDAFERCDGEDDDCDGAIDEACTTCDRAVPEDHADVQGALDAAADGEVVCVAPGEYVGCFDFGGRGVTLLGVEGPARTVLDADLDYCSVLTFAAGEGPDAVLRGFTLRRGNSETGGGLTIVDASPTIEDVLLRGNYSINIGGLGGGVYVRGGAPTFTNVIVRNSSSSGGGYDGFGWGFGGGMYLEATDAVLDNVDLVDNFAGNGGGGLALVGTTAVVTNTRVHSNAAEQDGGGGVYVDGGAPRFTNVRITENGVGSGFGYEPEGGGIYVTGGATPAFTNVLVAGNYAGDTAGGVHVEDGAPAFVNVIVTDNVGATPAITGPATFRHSNVWANTPADFADGDPTGVDGNLSVDPAFLDDAHHLRSTSPLVDAGDPGILDPDGSPSDIGVFGGPGAAGWDLDGDGFPAWWRPGVYDAATSPGADCNDDDATLYPGAGC